MQALRAQVAALLLARVSVHACAQAPDSLAHGMLLRELAWSALR